MRRLRHPLKHTHTHTVRGRIIRLYTHTHTHTHTHITHTLTDKQKKRTEKQTLDSNEPLLLYNAVCAGLTRTGGQDTYLQQQRQER